MKTLLISTLVMASLSTAIVFAKSEWFVADADVARNHSKIPVGLSTIKTIMEDHVEYELTGLEKQVPYRIVFKDDHCPNTQSEFLDVEDAIVVSSGYGTIHGFYDNSESQAAASIHISRLENASTSRALWSGCISLKS